MYEYSLFFTWFGLGWNEKSTKSQMPWDMMRILLLVYMLNKWKIKIQLNIVKRLSIVMLIQPNWKLNLIFFLGSHFFTDILWTFMFRRDKSLCFFVIFVWDAHIIKHNKIYAKLLKSSICQWIDETQKSNISNNKNKLNIYVELWSVSCSVVSNKTNRK